MKWLKGVWDFWKGPLAFILFIMAIFSIGAYFEPADPDAEGSHWDYSIFCDGAFKYKRKDRGVYLMLNSDGTPLRCGQKRY